MVACLLNQSKSHAHSIKHTKTQNDENKTKQIAVDADLSAKPIEKACV